MVWREPDKVFRSRRRAGYLEHRQQTLVEGIEISPGLLHAEVEPGPEHLHPQQGEDAHEEEEQEEEGGDRLDAVGEGHHQVGEGLPVPEVRRRGTVSRSCVVVGGDGGRGRRVRGQGEMWSGGRERRKMSFYDAVVMQQVTLCDAVSLLGRAPPKARHQRTTYVKHSIIPNLD